MNGNLIVHKNMHISIFPLPLALLICLIFSAIATPNFGQSLSVRKADGRFWVDASAPAETPGTLQVSHNLRLWVDVQDSIQNPVSVEINSSGESERYFRLIPSVEAAPEIRVMVIGDSMSADCCGWGAGLYYYFKPNAIVINYAQPSMSTEVFLESVWSERMLLVQPDYVFVQFAWVDGYPISHDPNQIGGTTPEDFKANMRTIINLIRGFNGTPFLVTMHASRFYAAEGWLVPWEHPYNAYVRELSAELNAPLLDLYRVSWDVINNLGREGAAFINLRPDDRNHVSELGARYFCRMFLRTLPETFGPYLTGIYDPPPPPPQN